MLVVSMDQFQQTITGSNKNGDENGRPANTSIYVRPLKNNLVSMDPFQETSTGMVAEPPKKGLS